MARNFVAASSQYARNITSTGTASQMSEPFTWAGWTRFNSAAVTNAAIWSVSDASNRRHLMYWWDEFGGGTGPLRLSMFSGNGGTFGQGTSRSITPDTNWHHVLGIVSATNARDCYVDGSNASGFPDSTNVTGIVGLADLVLGQYFPSALPTAGFYMDGDMAEMGIWTAALSQAEITALALGVDPRTVRPASLISYVPFGGRFDNEPDLVGEGPFTVVNSPIAAAHPRIARWRPRTWSRIVPNAGGGGGALPRVFVPIL